LTSLDRWNRKKRLSKC